jgi:hypothetical protein
VAPAPRRLVETAVETALVVDAAVEVFAVCTTEVEGLPALLVVGWVVAAEPEQPARTMIARTRVRKGKTNHLFLIPDNNFLAPLTSFYAETFFSYILRITHPV